ncbi:MAG: NTP transferase domain-containing protein [Acidobacteria bacterium]|nr:NTP transferase domain-containing protein [Acidobacteriota bacterium]
MMAVLLAGGKGTRLKPFTVTIPKPLLPLDDVPILEIVIRQLAAAGFDRIVLSLGHMHHLFAAIFGDGRRLGVKIEFSIEDEPLGTAGPLKLITDCEDDFLVMNGDILTTLDYRRLFEFHRSENAWATLAVHARDVQIDYGVVEVAPNGVLYKYIEKPRLSYSVSMGINILSRPALDFIPPGRKFDIPDLMLALKDAGKTVFCYETTCYWQDIGRFDDFQKANDDFVTDRAKFLPEPRHS